MERRHGWARPRRPGGFTLIEQIIALAVVAALACLASPALGHLVARTQLQTAQADLLAALQQARGQAVRTGRRTMLCPSHDGRRCADDVHWEDGWLLGHYRSDQADRLDGAPGTIAGGYDRLTILSTDGRRRIHFQGDGSAGGSNARFTLCRHGRAESALTVTVANSGRIYGAQASAEQAQRCAQGG